MRELIGRGDADGWNKVREREEISKNFLREQVRQSEWRRGNEGRDDTVETTRERESVRKTAKGRKK